MSKIYIIIKRTGIYPTYWAENIFAYVNQQLAKEAVVKLNVGIKLLKRAKDEAYKNSEKWKENNPSPTIPHDDFSSLIDKHKALNLKWNEWAKLHDDERNRFFGSLNYLTIEQKTLLINSGGWYDTNTSYSVQELELEDGTCDE